MVKFLSNLTSMGKDHHIALRQVMISEVLSLLLCILYIVFGPVNYECLVLHVSLALSQHLIWIDFKNVLLSFRGL